MSNNVQRIPSSGGVGFGVRNGLAIMKNKIKIILVNFIFYFGCFIGVLSTPILSLLNAALLFPLYLYDRRYFYKTQLSIVTFGYVYLGIRLNPFITYELEGDENTYRGPAIYIFNHISNADPFILACLLKIQFGFIYKDSLHKIPLCGIVLPLAGHIPLKFKYIEGTKIPIKEFLPELFARCKKNLESGISLIVFPEGTRSKDGKLKAFKHGFFRFAIEHGYPLVPCAIYGTDNIFPRFSCILTPGHASLRVGKPIWPLDIIGTKKPKSVNTCEIAKPDPADVEKLANFMQLEVYKLIKRSKYFGEKQKVQELEDKLETEKKNLQQINSN